MSKKQGTVKAISYLVIIMVIIAVCGILAYFTNGFTSNFKTFYVECNGQQILSSASGFEMTKAKPLSIKVKYTFGAVNNKISGYSVKIVPNVVPNKDFDFTLDDATYSYQAESDMTAGFDILQQKTLFTIAPKGNINEILKAVYPNYKISNCNKWVYENMFTLIVTSYDGTAKVKLNFTVMEQITGIILNQEVIVF